MDGRSLVAPMSPGRSAAAVRNSERIGKRIEASPERIGCPYI
jgi:hypothetical protein